MSVGGVSFDAIAIGFAVLGVLVAFAMHVFHSFRSGARALVDYADSRAEAQRAALRQPGPSVSHRIAAAVCIAALAAILAFAFARKFQLF